MVTARVKLPLVAVTITAPVPVTVLGVVDVWELEVVEELLPPPPPQPTINPSAKNTSAAISASLRPFELRSPFPANISPKAMAKVPSVHGAKCWNRRGARRLEREVGAVTVTVVEPE